MMPFPADAVPELPLWTAACPRCLNDAPAVTPTRQARTDTMLLAQYRCDLHGIEWGHYCPIELAHA